MYNPEGKRLGVTVLEVPVHSVSSLKSKEKHGYTAVALKLTNLKNKSEIREVRMSADDVAGLTVDQPLVWSDLLAVGDKVIVTGTSKGKGFAGVVKRHNMAGGPRTHGQSNRERSRGSSGSGTTPGRVLPGKRMAGRMGSDTVTIKGLKVIDINTEKNQIILDGSVPGKKTGIIRIAKA